MKIGAGCFNYDRDGSCNGGFVASSATDPNFESTSEW